MSCITGGGFMKCIPMNFSGRLVAAASAVMEMDEVLEARSACAGRSASSFRKSSFFTPSFSTIASMARSAPAQSSRERAARIRPEHRVAVGRRELPLLDELRERRAEPVHRLLRELRRGVGDDHRDARLGRDLRDARAHLHRLR